MPYMEDGSSHKISPEISLETMEERVTEGIPLYKTGEVTCVHSPEGKSGDSL